MARNLPTLLCLSSPNVLDSLLESTRNAIERGAGAKLKNVLTKWENNLPI